MKKILFICVFVASLFAQDSKYITLKSPMSNAGSSLIEIFSYDCPFCYKYDSIIDILVKNLPKNMTFTPYHISKKAEFGKEASEIFAVLLNRQKDSINKQDSTFNRVKKLYYESYHIKKINWSSKDDFLALGLREANMSKDEFNTALKDSKVQNMLKQWDSVYDIPELTQIPAFIVNGKYLIKLSEIKSIDELSSVINELNTKQ